MLDWKKLKFWMSFSIALFLSVSLWASPIADPGSRGIDWALVKEKSAQPEWAQVIERMKNSVRNTQSRYETPPLGTTGWLHEYYCDDDARRLQFDPNKPHEHICTKCQRIYSGPPYDDCWRSLVHSEIASAVAQSAILYRISDDAQWLEYPRAMLLWYADHFEQFEPHGKHAGKGIIREQSLDEATQLVRMAQAYWDIGPFLSTQDRETIAEKFLLPDARFIHHQTGTIHNIHSWHNAAVGLVGFAVGDKELVSQAIDGPFGLIHQIQKGTLEDGFWFEGSISYHFYTISSLEPLYLAARAQQHPLPHTEKFLRMYTAPIQFAFPNSEFPATNDGWPGQRLEDNVSYYEIANYLWEDPLLKQTLANFSTQRTRNSIEALLYGTINLPSPHELPSKSVLFQDSGIAILRNPTLNAYVKFGPYGGGHDHLDRLNLILFARGKVLMPDLGTSGYGIPLNAWYRAPSAHNLLVVDGKRQNKCGGYLVHYATDSIQVGVKDAYEGVDIQRTLALSQDGISDSVRAQSQETHRYDLFYHVRGTLKNCSIDLQDAESLGTANGYEYLKQIRKGQCGERLRVSWTLRDVPGELHLESTSSQPFEVYVGECPDNPADQVLSFIVLRTNTPNADWTSSIRVVDAK